MYYDAHTHLNSDKLYPQRQEHLAIFIAGGGIGLITIGVNHERNLRALDITTKHTHQDIFIKSTVGIHPGETTWGSIQHTQDIAPAIEQLHQLLQQYPEHIVAIGECGIDSHFDRDDEIQARQTQLFHAQCKLATAYNLPIVIHSRDNFDCTYDIIKQYPDLKIYFHCRGYGPTEVQRLSATFSQLWIGFCGNVSYPKAHNLRDSLRTLREINMQGEHYIHMLLETDAPYLSPQQHRGKTNTPAYIIDLYTYVSKQRNIPLTQLQKELQDNFLKLYT